jgi:hypothetical protein
MSAGRSFLHLETSAAQVLKTSIQRIGRIFPKVGMNKSQSKKEVVFLVVHAVE